jgi:hypothetical protein
MDDTQKVITYSAVCFTLDSGHRPNSYAPPSPVDGKVPSVPILLSASDLSGLNIELQCLLGLK